MSRPGLDLIIPFRFLSPEERAALAPDLTEHSFAAGELMVRQGDHADDRVFLLESGSVEILDASREPARRVSVIHGGHYFGERAALFGEGRRFSIAAMEPVRCVSLGGARFMRLVRESRTFAQALADILRDKQGIFAAFDAFMAELLQGVALQELSLRRILPRYKLLEPALHPHVADPSTIDFGALTYAIRRLPENVTTTFAWFLADNLPLLYSAPGETFRAVTTDARPRGVYEMLPGKSMVLLRDGLSDLIDFITCLCVYAVEARKIRKRLRDPKFLLAMTRFEAAAFDEAGASSTRDAERAFLRTLPFTAEEADKLCEVWRDDPVERLHEIALHHEDFAIEVRKQQGNYNSRHSELWIEQIAQATKQLVGHDPCALPADLRVHVISSNTHSVSNCLSSWLTEHAEEILAWGRRIDHKLAGPGWHERFDQVYALSRDYLAAHPEASAAKREAERHCGILKLAETAFTGIQVELIDTGALGRRPIDPGVTLPPADRRSLIVNIDFAFGQQAEEIVGTLVTLFGRNLDSVNVLGKAGALQGKRGDVLVATAFLEQTSDLLRGVPDPRAVDVARLARRVPDRGVHVGPLLTVAGTLLQNRQMLQFYHHVWRCVGLEMEGFYYFRKLAEAAELGLMDRKTALRFVYYVSDLPLDTHANLSGRMSALEGIPPLYAVTREILSAIFEQAGGRGGVR